MHISVCLYLYAVDFMAEFDSCHMTSSAIIGWRILCLFCSISASYVTLVTVFLNLQYPY